MQAKNLQCTGEHLKEHSKGGTASSNNIVAACIYCNQHRHMRKIDLSPKKFKNHVVGRIAKRCWHQIILHPII